MGSYTIRYMDSEWVVVGHLPRIGDTTRINGSQYVVSEVEHVVVSHSYSADVFVYVEPRK